jgi:hypothetical protein
MRQGRDDEEVGFSDSDTAEACGLGWEGNVWLGGVVPPLDAEVGACDAEGVLSAFSEGPC